MIKINNKDLVDETALNFKEAMIFEKFLRLEKKRHKDDIENISNTIKYLYKKFKVCPECYGDKVVDDCDPVFGGECICPTCKGKGVTGKVKK